VVWFEKNIKVRGGLTVKESIAINFLLSTSNLPFTIALGFMVGIGMLEVVTMLLGTGASSLIDSLLPEVNMEVNLSLPDVGVAGSPGALSKFLDWLRLGRVPVLALLVLFLFSFGITGLIFQSISQHTVGFLMPGIVASVPAFLVSIGFLRLTGGALAKIIPKDETEAVSEDSFVGRVAVITMGTAKRGQPAQAKLQDQYGQVHYVMVEPDSDGVTFETGSEALLVLRNGGVFIAISNPSGALVDSSD